MHRLNSLATCGMLVLNQYLQQTQLNQHSLAFKFLWVVHVKIDLQQLILPLGLKMKFSNLKDMNFFRILIQFRT